jgi:small subunit ribosomal protein S1
MSEMNMTNDEHLSMEELLNETPVVEKGDICEGVIVKSDDTWVFVDIGEKTEGRVPRQEFSSVPAAGTRIPVLVRRKFDQDGMPVLSHRAAAEQRNWDLFIEKHKDAPDEVMARIIEMKGKGAVVSFDGITGYLPVSEAADILLKENAGTTNEFILKIERVNPAKRQVILSRKRYVEEGKEKAWTGIAAKYKAGDIISGKVVRFVEFGVFVDLGGFEALLHNKDISWSKVFKRKKLVTEGEEREFRIIAINQEEKKISLSIKDLKEDPWSTVEQKYPAGSKIKGTVSTVANFGVFVEVEEGVEGFISAHDLSWTRKNGNPQEEGLRRGQEIEAVVLSIDGESRRIALGVNQVERYPWETRADRYPVGSVLKSAVKHCHVRSYLWRLSRNRRSDSLSDVSWEEKIKNLNELYKPGDEVDSAFWISIRPRCALFVRHQTAGQVPWETIRDKYPQNTDPRCGDQCGSLWRVCEK